MDLDREWTPFAMEAEYRAYGMGRIAEAHNRLRAAMLIAVQVAPQAAYDEIVEDCGETMAKAAYHAVKAVFRGNN